MIFRVAVRLESLTGLYSQLLNRFMADKGTAKRHHEIVGEEHDPGSLSRLVDFVTLPRPMRLEYSRHCAERRDKPYFQLVGLDHSSTYGLGGVVVMHPY